MEVIQKKGKNKHTFRLGQEQFEYAYEDGSAKGDVEVYYGDLPLKRSEQTEQNDWLRNVGVAWPVSKWLWQFYARRLLL